MQRLSHKQAHRALLALLGGAIVVEAGICFHCFHVRDAVTGSLVVTAWTREYILQVLEHFTAEV